MIQTETINTTINWGDAGFPIDTQISVDYVQIGKEVTVIEWCENYCPFDHPPQLWWDMLQEKIDDHFFELGLNATFKK